MRERLGTSPVCDIEGMTRAVETTYRHAWRRWCEKFKGAGAETREVGRKRALPTISSASRHPPGIWTPQVTRFARQPAVCPRQAPLRTRREDHSRRRSGPWQSCTEARPYTLTPVGRPADLRWHRIVPSREVQVVDAAGRLFPAGQVGQVR